MDKRIILAVAGSGKTTYIVNSLSLEKRSLLITYTDNNYRNLKNKIIKRFGYFPENITLYRYFPFLYGFCYKPFLWMETRGRGINWEKPSFDRRFNSNNKRYYFDSCNRVYHNRMAKYLDNCGVLEQINQRLEKYFDNLFVDEIQDFAGHDFNFIESIARSNLNLLFVGDFFQHTFDTSRDGNVNKNLYEDLQKFIIKLESMGLTVDRKTLQKSYRCSPTVCDFISKGLCIAVGSHRQEKTSIQFIDDQAEADKIFKCNKTIKLFYQKHYTYECFSRNWGDSKGEDQYTDVCVVLNKTTYEKYQKNKLNELKPQTRNKLYVACSRARNNLYIVPEDLIKKCLCELTT